VPGATLSPGAGRIRIIRADKAARAAPLVALSDEMAVALPLFWLALVLLALHLSVGYRRDTVMKVGIGLVVAGLLVLILRPVAGDVMIDAVAKASEARDASHDAWGIATSLLANIAFAVIAAGALLSAGAFVAGRVGRRRMTPD
jgi:hypothetical protein